MMTWNASIIKDVDDVVRCLRSGATATTLYLMNGERIAPLLAAAYDDLMKKQRERTSLIVGLDMSREMLEELVANLPKCIGSWTKGSGAHAVFSRDCGKPATWTSDALSDPPWTFCDEHAPEHLKDNGKVNEITRVPWFHVLQRRERLLAEGVIGRKL